MAKILIARLGAMGDILHALPAATAIRAALPNATIGWLVEERWSELLTAQGRKASPNSVSPQKPVVNNIHTLDTRRWRQHFFRPSATAEIAGAVKRVRKIGYDFALDFRAPSSPAFSPNWAAQGLWLDTSTPGSRVRGIFTARCFYARAITSSNRIFF